MPRGCHIQNSRAQGSRLRNHRDAARSWHVLSKRSIHAVVGVDHAQTVGAKEFHICRLADLCELLLQLRAFLASLLESCRDNYDGLCATRYGVRHRLLHQRGGDGDNREVNSCVARWQVGIALDPKDLISRRVDGKQLPFIFALNKVCEDFVPDFAGRTGRSDHCDALWI